MTLASDPNPDIHDWQDRAYVERWVASAASKQATRHPMLRRLASVLPLRRTGPVRVLDVGGGHGELTNQLLEEWPNATVVLQDFSGPMLEIAGERFAGLAGRVEFSRSDLMVPGWSSTLAGPFDAVVSAIAIHNVDDPGIIKAIYQEIFTLVAPGGAFVNLDNVFMTGPAMASLYEVLKGRPRPEEASVPTERTHEPASLINQLRWLEEIGFDEVDCLWKEWRLAALCGLRNR